jgi:hypothetical protein
MRNRSQSTFNNGIIYLAAWYRMNKFIIFLTVEFVLLFCLSNFVHAGQDSDSSGENKKTIAIVTMAGSEALLYKASTSQKVFVDASSWEIENQLKSDTIKFLNIVAEKSNEFNYIPIIPQLNDSVRKKIYEVYHDDSVEYEEDEAKAISDLLEDQYDRLLLMIREEGELGYGVLYQGRDYRTIFRAFANLKIVYYDLKDHKKLSISDYCCGSQRLSLIARPISDAERENITANFKSDYLDKLEFGEEEELSTLLEPKPHHTFRTYEETSEADKEYIGATIKFLFATNMPRALLRTLQKEEINTKYDF